MEERNEIEELLSPSMGRRTRDGRDDVPTFRSQMARVRQRLGASLRPRRTRQLRRGTVAVRAPNARSRRCVVKVSYVGVSDGNRAAKLHLAYLERDGVERDGSPGQLYGQESDFDRAAFDQPLAGEQRQFRLIVSPEDGDSMDLRAFARQFMNQVEKDLGRGLIWAAVNHYNTDNPHVHIVVRGVDRAGKDLWINGRYISQEMRWRAQEIATRELGPRTELDVARERSKELTRHGFTLIDRMLARHVADGNRLMPKRLATLVPPERAACLGRLATLEKMGIARQEAGGVWQLKPGWDDDLKRMEVISEARARLAQHIPNCLGAGQLLDTGQAFATVEGVVRGLGLHDELAGTMYVVVQGRDGAACYVPVRPEVAAELATGDMVRVSSPSESWVKATDRIVARFAAEHGGLYDPAAHQAALVLRAGRAGGEQRPSPAELVMANVRRLERLERYGLVVRDRGGRWRVPVDLLAKLEARETTHPRHRIRVERLGPARKIDRSAPEIARGRGRRPERSR
jgi:type IV secretory pathway VirD2 relaxase